MDDLPTEEDVSAFVLENRRWLPDEAQEIFLQMSKEDQRYVMKEGSLSNCRDPVAIIRSRAWNGCMEAHRARMETYRESSVDVMIDDFVSQNGAWINQEAEELLRTLDHEMAWKVVDFGSMHGCRDSVAIIKRRLRDAKAGKSGKGSRGYGPREGREGRDGKGSTIALQEETRAEEKERGQAQGKSKEKRPENDPHEKALQEQRSMYCIGLPSLWTKRQVIDFFSPFGDLDGVYMGRLRGKAAASPRTVSIDFTSAEAARRAALAYDRTEVKTGEDTFVLSCSIRYKVQGTPGSRFSFPGRAEGDPKQAQAEGRSIFLSKIPLNTTEEEIRELVEDFGEVQDVHMLPSNWTNMACFITMVSPGEAAFAIRGLNNAQAFGTMISASYPIEKNLKRRKPDPEDEQVQWYPIELRNFPHWTVCDDIKTIILSLGPGSQRVRIIHYDPEPSLSVARAYFREEQDRDTIQKALTGYEISPGYLLRVSALPRTSGTGRGFSHTPQPGQPRPPQPSFGALAAAAAQPLKMPEPQLDQLALDCLGLGSAEAAHASEVHGCSAANWNALNWNDWSHSGNSSTWLPAAFAQR